MNPVEKFFRPMDDFHMAVSEGHVVTSLTFEIVPDTSFIGDTSVPVPMPIPLDNFGGRFEGHFTSFNGGGFWITFLIGRKSQYTFDTKGIPLGTPITVPK